MKAHQNIWMKCMVVSLVIVLFSACSSDSSSTHTKKNTVSLVSFDIPTAMLKSKSSLAYSVLSKPSNGSMQGQLPNVSYSPREGFNGDEKVVFRMEGEEAGNERYNTIDITVIPKEGVENTVEHDVVLKQNHSAVIALQVSDVSAEEIVLEVSKEPANGIVSLENEQITYTPQQGFIGEDPFSIQVNNKVDSTEIVLVRFVAIATVTGALNDTGTKACYGGASGECSIFYYPGQDPEFGRDATNALSSDGDSGFSFTKLDENGEELPEDAAEWTCVRDNITGLIWEVKANSGLHSRFDAFSWYDSNENSNGGFEGYERYRNNDILDNTCTDFVSGFPDTYCNTEAFINRVNATNYCGISTWVMPTTEEIRSIVNYDHGAHTDKLDDRYFNELVVSNLYTSSGWSDSSSMVRGFRLRDAPISFPVNKNVPRGAMLVSRGTKKILNTKKAIAKAASEQKCSDKLPGQALSTRFAISSDGSEAVDSRTGLTWKRCLLGTSWNGSECTGNPLKASWSDGLMLIQTMGDGWRLPNVKELASIAETSCNHPALNMDVFPIDRLSTRENNVGTLMTNTVNYTLGSFYVMDMRYFTQATPGAGGNYTPYYLLVKD